MRNSVKHDASWKAPSARSPNEDSSLNHLAPHAAFVEWQPIDFLFQLLELNLVELPDANESHAFEPFANKAVADFRGAATLEVNDSLGRCNWPSEHFHVVPEFRLGIDEFRCEHFRAFFDQFVGLVVAAAQSTRAQRIPVSVVVLQFMKQREQLGFIGQVPLKRYRAIAVRAHVKGLDLSRQGPRVYTNTLRLVNPAEFTQAKGGGVHFVVGSLLPRQLLQVLVVDVATHN